MLLLLCARPTPVRVKSWLEANENSESVPKKVRQLLRSVQVGYEYLEEHREPNQPRVYLAKMILPIGAEELNRHVNIGD